MEPESLHILLIEDNFGDARLVFEHLRTMRNEIDAEVEHVTRVADGLNALHHGEYDILLLDLGLPDAQGLETVQRCVEQAPPMPIVVLTSGPDEGMAEEALRAGAQDYLLKDTLEPRNLVRALRYAQARFALLQQERDLLKYELRMLSHAAREGQTPVTARSFGAGPLRESSQMVFRELLDQYGRVLEESVETRSFKENGDHSEPLLALADTIGFLGGGPRDVIDIHVHALESRVQGVAPARARVYIEEGRMLVLELMGNVLAFYRTNAVFGGSAPPEQLPDTRAPKEPPQS